MTDLSCTILLDVECRDEEREAELLEQCFSMVRSICEELEKQRIAYDFQTNGVIAGAIAPVFAPAGFGTVEASTAVLTGVMAKESVVSTLSVLAGVDPDSAQMVTALHSVFPTVLQAVSFLTFVLLYMPCVAAYAAMRREMESGRLATVAVAGQTVLAWVAATLVFQVGRLLGLG